MVNRHNEGMKTLFVAAGGGGDAVGTLLARRVLDPDGEAPTLISTCAWERLRIDPTPGPRPISGFTGLGDVDGHPVEMLGSSRTTPPGRSVLPRLAYEADARIFLHDFEGGAKGLAEQLRHLVAALEVERIVVVDVGGDVVATGVEPNLLSPLADSLALAGALATGIPTNLAVVGPGADAELTEHEVLERLSAVNGQRVGEVSAPDVECCGDILDWHPTEASALVAAAALQARGAVEMRRGRAPTPLTERGSGIWVVAEPRLASFPLANSLVSTLDLQSAVEAMDRLSVNEIAYERTKAAQLLSSTPSPGRSVSATIEDAIRNGASHITSRRLLEQLGVPRSADQFQLDALASQAKRVAGLWILNSMRGKGPGPSPGRV